MQSDLYYPRYLGGVDFKAKTMINKGQRILDTRGMDNRGLAILQKSWEY